MGLTFSYKVYCHRVWELPHQEQMFAFVNRFQLTDTEAVYFPIEMRFACPAELFL